MNFIEPDSIDQLVCLLKLKRFIGIIPDSVSYSRVLKSTSLTDKAVFQPKPVTLGISDQDDNIDVSLAELVDEYEKQYGTIILEQIDFTVSINQPLPAHRRLKKKRTQKAIIDYRKNNLANNIQSSSYQKIIVVYGLAHKNGTFDELKKTDPTWKVIKS